MTKKGKKKRKRLTLEKCIENGPNGPLGHFFFVTSEIREIKSAVTTRISNYSSIGDEGTKITTDPIETSELLGQEVRKKIIPALPRYFH